MSQPFTHLLMTSEVNSTKH